LCSSLKKDKQVKYKQKKSKCSKSLILITPTWKPSKKQYKACKPKFNPAST
jgi:hypothetical protein